MQQEGTRVVRALPCGQRRVCAGGQVVRQRDRGACANRVEVRQGCGRGDCGFTVFVCRCAAGSRRGEVSWGGYDSKHARRK